MWNDLSDGIKSCIFAGRLPKLTIYLTVTKSDAHGGQKSVTLVSGVTFTLKEGSAVRRYGALGENGTLIGACDIGSFDFEIMSAGSWNYSFTDATFRATLTYTWLDANNTETSETINWGKYFVVGHEFGDSGRTIRVHGYDYMAKLDLENVVVTDLYDGSHFVYGGQLLNKITEGFEVSSTYYGAPWVSADGTPVTGDNRMVIWRPNYYRHGKTMTWPAIPTMTKRQALRYLLQLKNLYAYMDNDGKLCIRTASLYDRVSTGARTQLKSMASQAPGLYTFPYFSVDVAPALVSGVKFTNFLLPDEVQIFGDLSAVYCDISNPFFVDDSGGADNANVYNEGTAGITYSLTRYYMTGSLKAMTFLLAPGEIVETDPYVSNPWCNIKEVGGSAFVITSVAWKEGSTSIDLSCETERPEYADLRKEPTDEEVIPDIFYTGTTTVGTEKYKNILLTGKNVPARYLTSYVIIASATGGTITRINKTATSFTIYTDTANVQVSYQICRPSVDSGTVGTTSASPTNYGALAQEHINQTEASYTS